MAGFVSALEPILGQLTKRLLQARSECEEYAASSWGQDCLKLGVYRDSYLLMRSAVSRFSEEGVNMILGAIGYPLPCTKEEITSVLEDHLPVSAQGFESAIARIVSLLDQRTNIWHYSKSFLICSGPLFIGSLDNLQPIWQFQAPVTFLSIEVSGYSHAGDSPGVWDDDYSVENPSADGIEDVGIVYVRPGRLSARVRARCSPAAMGVLEKTLTNIVPSLFRSACMIEEYSHESIFDRWQPEYDEDEMMPTEDKLGPDPVVVFTTTGQLGTGFLWIREALGAFFVTGALSKKDTFERRIRNAVVLLVESDSQTNSAIRLALCVTAIEAVLGKRSDDVNRTLPEKIAVLLEPDPSQRLNAEGFTKGLYELRSRALHGEAISSEEKTVGHARLLAAAVLKAFIELILFSQRMQLSVDTPDQLLAFLKSQKYEKGLPTGIQESPVRNLWIVKKAE